jgi:sigma-B regulation protein RsbU (phosphoserine phosphatase)
MKILIVDDAADIRAWLKILLENAGWEVEQANGGEAACRILENSDIRIVITDWIMPGMDGIRLIDWIRSRHANDYIYTILMTSLDQEEDCVKGLSCGADDFLTKPTSPSVLNARLSVAMRILSIQQDLVAQQEQLRESRDLVTRAYALVQEDLKGASVAQRSLLPGSGHLSSKVETAWFFHPAMGVSGDCLDIFTVGEDKLVFYLLDVSGHGITAALRSAAISQLLRPIGGLTGEMETKGPAHVLERLNQHLCDGNQELDYLATIVLGDFDTAKGIIRLASAGHPPPLILAGNEAAKPISSGGIPLGIDAQAKYSDVETVLNPGEMVLLYSDGLHECENEQGQQLGLNSLMHTAEINANLAPAEMLASLETCLGNWRAGRELADDLSALALKYTGEHTSQHAAGTENGQWLAA